MKQVSLEDISTEFIKLRTEPKEPHAVPLNEWLSKDNGYIIVQVGISTNDFFVAEREALALMANPYEWEVRSIDGDKETGMTWVALEKGNPHTDEAW